MGQRHQRNSSSFRLGLYALVAAAGLMSVALATLIFSVFPVVALLAIAAVAIGGVLLIATLLTATALAANTAMTRHYGKEVAMERAYRIGKVEAGLVLLAGLLVAVEVFAVINGYGVFFAVVLLGYFMAAGAGYLVYRNIQTERRASANQATAKSTVREALKPEPIGLHADHSRTTAREADLLRGLSEEQAEAVLALAHWDSIPAGTRLAQAGTKGDSIYIIVDGKVELSGRSEVGEVTVRIAGPGESFPLAAILGEGTLVTSATAMTDLMAYVITPKQLKALSQSRPDIGMAIHAAVAELLADRYRSMLTRHLSGVNTMVRQADVWANV